MWKNIRSMNIVVRHDLLVCLKNKNLYSYKMSLPNHLFIIQI